jgi:tryptophan 2,3-dioxygenase
MNSDNAVTYARYLELGTLLDQQHPRSADASGDELMFIVAHQTCELWFKVILRELTAVRDTITAGAIEPALLALRRIAAVQQVLLDQVAVLESMHPGGFLAFRDLLGTASGYESVQYREIEFLAGLKDEGAIEPTASTQPGGVATLNRRYSEPSVWDAVVSLLVARALAADTSDRHVRDAVTAISTDPVRDFLVWQLLRALLEFDRDAALWRARHVQMVEEMIGRKPGTGGSSGVGYLASRVDVHYFPVLWDAASLL